jgi:hypothetical protein
MIRSYSFNSMCARRPRLSGEAAFISPHVLTVEHGTHYPAYTWNVEGSPMHAAAAPHLLDHCL